MMTSELEPETFVASVFRSQRRTGKPSSRANDRWAGLERAGRCDPGVCAFSCPQQCGYAKALGCAASAFTLGKADFTRVGLFNWGGQALGSDRCELGCAARVELPEWGALVVIKSNAHMRSRLRDRFAQGKILMAL